jgi:hypothetical protein
VFDVILGLRLDQNWTKMTNDQSLSNRIECRLGQ